MLDFEQNIQDHFFMERALDLAKRAFEENEVPVGAIVICGNRIIGKGYNQTERLKDVTAHAEMMAITAAANYLGSKYLTDCTLYVTLEPCVMCAGALQWAQLSRIVVGAEDGKRGFMRYGLGLLHSKTAYAQGIMAEESQSLLRKFFSRLRT